MSHKYFSLAFEYKQGTPAEKIVGGWDWMSFVAAEEELRTLVEKLGDHVRVRHAESTTDGYLYKFARADVEGEVLSEVIEKVAEDLHLEYIIGVSIAAEEEDMNPSKCGFHTLSDYMDA